MQVQVQPQSQRLPSLMRELRHCGRRADCAVVACSGPLGARGVRGLLRLLCFAGLGGTGAACISVSLPPAAQPASPNEFTCAVIISSNECNFNSWSTLSHYNRWIDGAKGSDLLCLAITHSHLDDIVIATGEIHYSNSCFLMV